MEGGSNGHHSHKRTSESGAYSESGLPSSSSSSLSTPSLPSISSCLRLAAALPLPLNATSYWAAFSGLLNDEVINNADWGDRRPKKQSASSHSVYDIAKFDQVTGSATMNSSARHVAYHLTAAKVKAPELVVDYEPLQAAKPISVLSGAWSSEAVYSSINSAN